MRGVVKGVFAAAILAAAGCLSRAPSERVQNPASTPNGELHFAWDLGLKATVRLAGADPRRPPAIPQAGDLVPFSLTIRNESDLPVLLLSVVVPGAKVPTYSWQRPLSGELRARAAADQYTFTPATAPGAPTEPLFNDGLLLPGEDLTVPVRGRCLDTHVVFQIRALPLPGADLCRLVYAPSTRSDDAPAGVTEPVVFSRVTPEVIRGWSSQPAAATDSHRTVLFRPDRAPTARTLTIDIPVYPRPAKMPLAEAAKRCGLAQPPSSFTYSSLLKAWVLDLGRRTCAVGERGIQEWPRSDLEAFDLLDAAEGTIRVEMTETAAYGLRNICTFEREMVGGGVVYVASLLPAETSQFLGELERRRLSFDVATTASGGWSLRVR